MKKMIFGWLMLPALLSFGQTGNPALNDTAINSKLEQIKDNIDQLFQTFKTDKQPDPEVNFDDAFYTDLTFYNTAGSVYKNDFDNNLSFRISSDDYKKATRADFEKAYTEFAEDLRTIFDFLEIREKQTAEMKELTLFEMGKDTEAPVASSRSPKYYINLKFKEEKDGKKTSYSLFLYITSKN
jgi:hypothetical protein